MMNQLTYQQKNRYLLGLAAVFMGLAYGLAISKTTALYRANQRLGAKIGQAQQIKPLEAKLNELDTRLNDYRNQDVQGQYLMERVSTLCQQHHLVLRTFPKAETTRENDFAVETSRILVEGDFQNLLKLTYDLEREKGTGKVASLSFQSYPDNKRKELLLGLTMHVQNIQLK